MTTEKKPRPKRKRGPKSVPGGAPVGAEPWTPPTYSGDPNLTRGPMRTGTLADFDVDLDDGHNMQTAIHTTDPDDDETGE